MTPGVVDRARSARASVAVGAARALNGLSRLTGRGSGTVVGGRVGLGIDPKLLTFLADRRATALVSGTNGKTTTTAMLVVALAGAQDGSVRVATNRTGANMPAGHVAALMEEPDAEAVVLEVDEGYLGELIADTRPKVVVLLNLSRDQLDRISEVRMLVEEWRSSLGGLAEDGGTVVVANADDPMVAWSASTAPDVRWVGAGQVWHEDAVGCPSCGGRIRFEPGGDWHCDTCRFARPERLAWLDGEDLVLAGGDRHRMALAIPGGFNRSNAAMVVVAAGAMPVLGGRPPVTPAEALERIGRLAEVAGRYSTVRRRGREVRLLLAKNPAGWTALFDLLDESGEAGCPVVLSVNARVADGHDPSWLWDVPFERLSGRKVMATGERCRDLAVRLRYAEVEHETVEDPVAALDTMLAGTPGSQAVEFLGNYTAFAMVRARL